MLVILLLLLGLGLRRRRWRALQQGRCRLQLWLLRRHLLAHTCSGGRCMCTSGLQVPASSLWRHARAAVALQLHQPRQARPS